MQETCQFWKNGHSLMYSSSSEKMGTPFWDILSFGRWRARQNVQMDGTTCRHCWANGQIFHSVETFFPLCGKFSKKFSILWKNYPSFFHSVENGACPHFFGTRGLCLAEGVDTVKRCGFEEFYFVCGAWRRFFRRGRIRLAGQRGRCDLIGPTRRRRWEASGKKNM